MHRTLLTLWSVILLLSIGSANTFYLDPVNGDLANPGSQAQPWPSLSAVVGAGMIESRIYSPLPYDAQTSQLVVVHPGAPAKGGDTLVLLGGLHGEVWIERHVNDGWITVRAMAGQEPVLASLRLRASGYWRFEGLTVSSEPYGFYTYDPLVFIESHGWQGPSHDVEIRDCTVKSGDDALAWSQQQWLDRVTNGIMVTGDDVLVEDNLVTNIYMGISLVGSRLVARNNNVVNFAGDGMRALGPHMLIEGNLIKNCFDIDENHDDGIQSFNLGTYDVRDITIRNNIILNTDDPDQPLLGPLQGIGCFDGPYTDWLIENNVVMVNHWHGIALYEAHDCRILNNTVIDPTPGVAPGPSWIRVQDGKDGTPSTGCIVRNNLTNTLVVDADASHNLLLAGTTAYDATFTDWTLADLHLVPGSQAIDAGDTLDFALTDLDGIPRPQGTGVDVGAYEFVPVSTIGPLSRPAFRLAPNPFRETLVLEGPGAGDLGPVRLISVRGTVIPPLTVARQQDRIDFRFPTGLSAGVYWLEAGPYRWPVVRD